MFPVFMGFFLVFFVSIIFYLKKEVSVLTYDFSQKTIIWHYIERDRFCQKGTGFVIKAPLQCRFLPLRHVARNI